MCSAVLLKLKESNFENVSKFLIWNLIVESKDL